MTEDEALKETAKQILQNAMEESVSEKTLDSTVEFMRLLLLARLVEITGIVWMVRSDRSKWDFQYHCRWGFGIQNSLAHDFGLEKSQEYIDDKMGHVAWMIAKAYWKRIGKEN